MDTLRLSVSTFGRVFDVTPQADALTLAELVAALHRFQLRNDLAHRQARDLERARAAAAAIRSRTPTGGPLAKRLQRHLDQTGDLDLALFDLERDIQREAKQDLRLWAPLRFADGQKREDAHVVHVSCMVLDFDRMNGPGLPTPESLQDAFSAYFHVAHSTWSHTPERPKLRLVLPLSAPIVGADFDKVWHALNTVAGGTADPTGRSLARAWALPAVPGRDTPRLAWSHAGPLYDPFSLGLASAPSSVPPHAVTGACYLRPDSDHVYLPPLDDDAWEAPPTPTPPPPHQPNPALTVAPTPAPAPPTPDTEARLAALEARVAALERVLGDYL